MICPICADKYTPVMRKAIKCETCQYSACTECVKRYLVQNNSEWKCMKCGEFWTRQFVDNNLSHHFRYKDLRKQRQQLLFDMETARLPETQDLVPVYRNYKVHKNERDRHLALYNKTEQEIKDQIAISPYLFKKSKEYRKLCEDNIKCYQKYMGLNNTLYNFEEFLFRGRGRGSQKNEKKPVVEFVKKCTKGECRGILTSKWKCPVCETQFCNKCQEEKIELSASTSTETNQESHVCNEDTIKSVSLMKKDTKQCPACHVPVFRVSGCPQMWCTICHTAFDWTTGEIITGNIHNPHYFQWLRQTGNDADEGNYNRCDPPNERFVRMYRRKIDIPKSHPTVIEFLNVVQLISHINYYEIRESRNKIASMSDMRDDPNRKPRLLYLVGDMSEHEFRMVLWKREERRVYYNDEILIFEALINSLTYMLFKAFDSVQLGKTKENEKIENDIIHQITQVIEYANRSLGQLAENYKKKYKWEIIKDTYYRVTRKLREVRKVNRKKAKVIVKVCNKSTA